MLRPQFCGLILLLLLICPYAFTETTPAESCPRPAVGSIVTEPEDLRSRKGVLSVELDYRSSLDAQGQTRFCFVTKDGSQSPNLRLKPGDELILTLKNNLSAPPSSGPHNVTSHNAAPPCTGGAMTAVSTNLHFHGLVIAPICHQDDTLNTAIQPTDPPFEYRFKIPKDQPPGLYWYHPHIHGFTRAHAMGGASGALIVEGIDSANREVRGLPERIFVIREQELLHPDAEPIWLGPGPAPKVIKDADGDVINTGTGTGTPAKDLSINFVPVPFPEYQPAVIMMRPSEKQFWRVLNASAITYVDVQLLMNSVPQSLGIVAIDGIPINHEHPERQNVDWKTHVLLPPAARVEFIVTGPPAGANATLVTRSVDTGRVGDNDPVRSLAIISTAANAPAPPSRIGTGKSILNPSKFAPLRLAKPVRQRLLYFSETRQDPKDPTSPTLFFVTVDGQEPKQFDPSSPLPNITVQAGTVEDWTIENRSLELHAFHIHQTHFQLLEWNGLKVTEPFLRDTVNVPYWAEKMTAFPSVKLRMDFRDPNIVGTFAYHCHLLEHQDGGMMGIIRVEPRPSDGKRQRLVSDKTVSHNSKAPKSN